MISTASPDIVVVGSVNWDYSAIGTTLPRPGETTRGRSLLQGIGGKGANQAVAAARLGVRTALLACVGDDALGENAAQHLRAEGVDTSALTVTADAHTGAALIFVGKEGEKQIVVVPGANDRLLSTDVENASNLLRSARAVIAQLEVPVATVLTAFRIAKAAGALTVLDPAPAHRLPDELYRLTDAIKPNRSEAEILTGIVVEDRATARQAADILLGRGVGLVTIQAGNAGTLVATSDVERWVPRFRVATVDATGAGDAFTAALSLALVERSSPGEAARFASAAAALSTTKLGAQPGFPSRSDVEQLIGAQ